MKRIFFCFALCAAFLRPYAQTENPYTSAFLQAYQAYPHLPKGSLEAVSWHYTRVQHLSPSVGEQSCTGMPAFYSLMGLVEDGKGYFRNSLAQVSQFSGIPAQNIKSDPQQAVLAYAAALNALYTPVSYEHTDWYVLFRAALELSELPWDTNSSGQQFAQASFIYSLATFLQSAEQADNFDFQPHSIPVEKILGDWTIYVKSTHVTLNPASGELYDANQIPARIHSLPLHGKSADYGPAIWTPAPTCNYGSRNGVAVSAVTIHTVQGSYSSCISWFQNCNAGVAAHYVIRSVDGQVTQMVSEADKGYHVGTENGYTIGIEHEGYVNNPAWYTAAMYTGSSSLVLDILNSGYGINSLRTAWWPWVGATYYNQSSIPGSCSRVKGHQHYPNQTHTDPGPNWNWDKFYKLLNPNPFIQILTALNGTITDPGGNSNYADDQRQVWTVQPPNVATVTLQFTQFNLENTWDYLYIYDGPDIHAPLIGYYTGTNSPGTISSTQGTITLEFRSDCATTAPGFSLNYNTTPVNNQLPDNIPPQTLVSAPGSNWKTQDFPAFFTESDDTAGTGINQAFYQVLDYDGFEWRANAQQGFFSDNFDLGFVHPEWSVFTGNWDATGNTLNQTDEVNSNTNLYTTVRQDLADVYLYHFALNISGSGNTRRAGFHYLADTGALPNRGNGYFIWVRLDDAKLQFYRVANDIFSLESEAPMTTVAGQWYDFKVIYDRTTGKTQVYRDNVFIADYTDPNFYTTGNYISFRTGNAQMQANDLKVYHARIPNTPQQISVIPTANAMLRFLNQNPSTPAARINSIVSDSAGNLSAISHLDLNIDISAPAAPAFVNDSLAFDIDSSSNFNYFTGEWGAAVDTQSAISRYWYSVGTSPGDSNFIGWTDNWIFLTSSDTLNIPPGMYYLQVRAENGAGLVGNPLISDGILYVLPGMFTGENEDSGFWAGPNPASGLIQIGSDKNLRYSIANSQGQFVWESGFMQQPLQVQTETWPRGIYHIIGRSETNRVFVRKIILQ